MTATEASRHFSDLLDAVERGETIIIVRGGHPVAAIGPAHRCTGASLRAALADVPPPDEAFSRDIASAIAGPWTARRWMTTSSLSPRYRSPSTVSGSNWPIWLAGRPSGPGRWQP